MQAGVRKRPWFVVDFDNDRSRAAATVTSSRFIAEKLLLALVALTIGVLLFHPPLLEVRMVIAPGDPALRFELDSDVQDGGNTVTEWLDEGRLSWRCVLGDRFPYPFCGMQIHFSERYQDGIEDRKSVV